MSPSSLRPCDSCGRFRRHSDDSCSHCGDQGRSLPRSTRAALLGLAIGSSFACVQEAKYGSPYYPEDGDTADTADTADPDKSEPGSTPHSSE